MLSGLFNEVSMQKLIVVYIILFKAFRMNAHDAFHETVHSAPGGHEALAIRMGMSAAVLRNKANPNAAANVVALRDVEAVMGLTGNHAVLHALAQCFGYVCVKVGDDATASDVAVLELMAAVWAKNGEVGAAINEALADRRVEQHEVEKIMDVVYSANRALQELGARFKGMAEK